MVFNNVLLPWRIYFKYAGGGVWWRAAKKAKLKSIPAYVLHIDSDAEMMEVALIENIQRENLNAIEEHLYLQFLLLNCLQLHQQLFVLL